MSYAAWAIFSIVLNSQSRSARIASQVCEAGSSFGETPLKSGGPKSKAMRTLGKPSKVELRVDDGTSAAAVSPDEGRATLASIFPQLFARLDVVGELIVVKTVVAGAQPIAEAIDSEGNPDVLGTIAGENTILLICRSEAARERIAKRLLALAKR